MLPISEATYHYWKRRFNRPDKNQALRTAIKTICQDNPHYGVRRVYLTLRNMDSYKKVNHKKVQRLMHEMHLEGAGYRRVSRRYDSSKGPEGKRVKNRLHRKFKTDRPNQKLVSDVTEFKVPGTGEKVYLEPIMDLYNNEIIAYALDTRPNLAFALRPLKQLFKKLPKLSYRTTIHTDQGWQYRHRTWRKLLKKHHVFQSMSRRATCLDNAAMESFFNKLKVEIGPLKNFSSAQELMKQVKNWLIYYNNQRIQTKLGGKSPKEFRQFTA